MTNVVWNSRAVSAVLAQGCYANQKKITNFAANIRK